MTIAVGDQIEAPQVYREHDAGRDMPLGCGHRADGIVRGSGDLYYCPTCGTAEESIYSVQARKRHRKAGWTSVFRKLRARAKRSPDAELGRLVARELVPLIQDLEGAGWSHGHRDEDGACSAGGEDCIDCERLDRIRKWVEAHA